MNSNQSYFLHASNIAGLGSCIVVSNLLNSLSKNEILSNKTIYLSLPKIPFWQNNIKKYEKLNWKIQLVNRSKFKLIRYFKRLLEIFIGHKMIPDVDVLIVFGDFPLRFNKKQIVLFHNMNLINNNFNIEFFFHKLFFKYNLKFITKCVIQSNVVEKELISNYPILYNKIQILPMPVDEIFEKHKNKNKNNSKLECFYPASFYKHKNHKVIIDFCKIYKNDTNKYNFYFTLPNLRFKSLSLENISSITNLGNLSKQEIYLKYSEIDVLIFPSLLESYGLPLIEAMKMDLYIICSDLPYAKWLCGDQAKYFNPHDPFTLKVALNEILNDKSENIKPNWSKALSKIPKNWDIYSTNFLN